MQSEMILVSIYDPLALEYRPGPSKPREYFTELLEEYERDCHLEGVCYKLMASSSISHVQIGVKIRLEAGASIHERLCNIAAEEKARLMVVGSHGDMDDTPV